MRPYSTKKLKLIAGAMTSLVIMGRMEWGMVLAIAFVGETGCLDRGHGRPQSK